MTREEILAMEAGRELDAVIAETIFGWRRIKGPPTDYYGPCEYGDVLIPPEITIDEEAFRMMSPKGSIPFTYFVNRKWSTDITATWKVIEKFGHHFSVETNHSGGYIASVNCVAAFAITAPEAICKAALLAVLGEEEAK